MTKKAYTQFNLNTTPANVQAYPDQIKNEAGGYGFPVSKWQRLNRFLFLGTEGGTYYTKEAELTRENAKNVLECVHEDGIRVVRTVTDLSISGRTFKQSPLLFTLALAATEGNEATRRAVYDTLPNVARIPTHLFEFVQYRTQFGGWGRGLRNAVAKWYTERDPKGLAYHLVKYQSRGGWSNADLIKLAHPKTSDPDTNNLFRWALGKEVEGVLPEIIQGFEKAKVTEKTSDIIKLITDYDLPREAVPTQFLNDRGVWEALLEKMPLTAMIRNLGKMTQVGLLETGSSATRKVVDALRDEGYLKKSRIHPMSVLLAHHTYANGQGFRGSLSWSPIRQILDVTDEAFYLTFGNVKPTNKSLALAIDTSGSMSAAVAGTNLSCFKAGAAMALITLNVEPDALVYEFGTGIQECAISPRQRLDDALASLKGMGGTNCSLPMVLLTRNNIKRDAIVIYTDHETWADMLYAGNSSIHTGHPFEELKNYRRKVNMDARLVTLAMAATRSSIGQQDDPKFLEMVGLDSDAPSIVSSFISDEF